MAFYFRDIFRFFDAFDIGIKVNSVLNEPVPKNSGTFPRRVICPYCAVLQRPQHRRKQTYVYMAYFTTILLTTENFYVSCSVCRSFLGFNECFVCRNCRCFAAEGFKYCIKCGILLEDENRINF